MQDHRAGNHTFNPDQTAPIDFKVRSAEHKLIVSWRDGHLSEFSTVMLRKQCPCATCNTERRERQQSSTLLPILSKDPGVGPPRLIGAALVGSYAIQFTWSDGHNTGIFDFKFLRSLDTDSGS